MTDAATKARELATSCEAIKYALRQSKDGVVVSFVLHPSEIPADVQLAPIGSRFVLAFVAIGDDEQPKEVMPHQRASTKLAGPDKSSPASDQAASPAAPVRAKIAWHEMAPPQQAGVLCNDPKFHQFLREEFPLKSASVRRDLGRDGAEMAATLVRSHCIVTSRSRIRNGHTSGRLWRELVEQYRAWEMAPQAGAA